MAQTTELNLAKDSILCVEQENNADLYYLLEGELMVCVSQQSMITALAFIQPGEFIGELSFFDGAPRSDHVIASLPSKIQVIPRDEIQEFFPDWLLKTAKSMTEQIRLTDSVIQARGIRKQGQKEVKTLSIQEQGHYYHLLKNHVEKLAKKN
jgi:CRP-like cAMP-binding protein